jgi:CHAT domain-containing protein
MKRYISNTIIYLCLLQIFNYSHTFAQALNEKYLSGVKYLNTGSIDSAINEFDSIISNYNLGDSTSKDVYIQSLLKLSEIYNRKSNYFKTKEILDLLEAQSLSNYSEKYYLRYLGSIVFYYIQIFDYEKAWETNQTIIEIKSKNKSDQCSLANEYNINGEICRRLELKESSIVWYKKAYKIKRMCGDTTSSSYASIFNNLALVYTGTDTATNYLKFSLSILDKIKDSEPVDYSNVLLNLIINSYYYSKDTLLAINLLKPLLLKYKKYLSSTNLERLFLVNSDLYSSIGLDSISANSLRVYYFLKRKNIIDWCKLSSNEVENILDNDSFEEEELAYRLMNKLIISDSKSVEKYQLTNQFYNLISLKKSLLMRRSISAKAYFEKSDEIKLKEIYNEMLNKSNLLNDITKLNSQDDSLISKLKKQIDSLENLLLLKSSFYQNLNTFLNISVKNILEKIKGNEACIEFYEFKNSYYAIILSHSFINAKIVHLFDVNSFEYLLEKKSSLSNIDYINSLYLYRYAKDKLYNLVWKNIDPYLKGIDKIYISQFGLLHNINISAIPMTESRRLSDQYKFHFISSTNEVASNDHSFLSDSTFHKAWLFGAMDYNNASKKYSESNSVDYSEFKREQITTNRNISYKWEYLLNTLYEVYSIDSLCKNNKVESLLLTGSNATKSEFKNISGQKDSYLLHIATHGFYFLDTTDISINGIKKPEFNPNYFTISKNPLLRTGLVFSGANKSFSKMAIPRKSYDDGILTALEISNLNFSEARLIVLSACETGLGDIQGSEGVFGLQRAFKLAGAKNIIMSLWKVPDLQTKELMILFYQKYFLGHSVSEALRLAQSEMSKTYPPYYWAAFKILE